MSHTPAPAAARVLNEWWRNSHAKAQDPLGFTNSAGRFSAPDLPRRVLYLGQDAATSFWESGLGRELNSRPQSYRTVTKDDLASRLEYRVPLNTAGLRLFDARDAVARRAIGAQTIACFAADHATSREWARALMQPGTNIDGIIYESARQGPAAAMALFDTPRSLAAVPAQRPSPVRSSWENTSLLNSLDREAVTIIGDLGLRIPSLEVPEVARNAVLLRLENMREIFPNASKAEKGALLEYAREIAKGIPGPDLTGVPLRVNAQDFVAGRVGREKLAQSLEQHVRALARTVARSQDQNRLGGLAIER